MLELRLFCMPNNLYRRDANHQAYSTLWHDNLILSAAANHHS